MVFNLYLHVTTRYFLLIYLLIQKLFSLSDNAAYEMQNL